MGLNASMPGQCVRPTNGPVVSNHAGHSMLCNTDGEGNLGRHCSSVARLTEGALAMLSIHVSNDYTLGVT